MTLEKKLLITGTVLLVLPVALLVFDEQMLNCAGKFLYFGTVLDSIDQILELVPRILVFSLPIGLSILLYVFWVSRRKKGVSKVSVATEILGLLILFGILGSIQLASLNSTRNKGPSAAVMASLSHIRAAAEIEFDRSQSYAGVCESSPETAQIFERMSKMTYKQGHWCSEWSEEINCTANAEAYAVTALLPQQIADKEKDYYCVDSSGFVGMVDAQHTGTSCQ